MDSGERAEKRARVGEPAAAVAATPQASPTFDALPDPVFGRIFCKELGLQESWPLRAVCRRWRSVVEGTEWPSFELRTAAGKNDWGREASDAGPARYASASALVGKRKLQLCSGASVSLWADWREVKAACGLLAALAGGGSPGEVAFKVSGPERGLDEDGFVGEFDRKFLRGLVLGVLEALRPPQGAPSALHGLHLALTNSQDDSLSSMPLPPPAELRAALAPFGELRSLTLFFQALQNGLSPAAAGAVAEACPLLRRLALRAAGEAEAEVLEALAPLAGLERLALLCAGEMGDLAPALAALADGPAGQSLRSLELFNEGTLEAENIPQLPGAFSERVADLARVELGDDALAALARMPALERVVPLRLSLQSASPEAVRGLAGAAALRELFLRLHDADSEEASGEVLAALADALAALPDLSALRIELTEREAAPEGVAALLSSAGARRALSDLALTRGRRLSAAEAEALAALPALRRLRLTLERGFADVEEEGAGAEEEEADGLVAFLRSGAARGALQDLTLRLPGPLSEAAAAALAALPALRRLHLASAFRAPFSARPHEVLAGLRPEVGVRVELTPAPWGGGGDEDEDGSRFREAEEAVERLFAGREMPDRP